MIKKRIKCYHLNDKKFWFGIEFWKLGPEYYAIIEYLGLYASIRFNDLLHAIVTIQMMKELDGVYFEEGKPFWSVALEKSHHIFQKVSNCKRRIMNEPMLKRYLKDTWTEIKKRI